jgi:thiamine-phosphate pyrophosphorylase
MKKIEKFHYLTQDMQIPHEILAEKAIKAGAKWLQLRVKNKSATTKREIAISVQEMCKKNNVTFIINDDVVLAKELNADGVHLGKKDMSISEARIILGNDKIIGGTANTFSDIKKIVEEGGNYVGLGPYRFTQTKENLSEVLGLEAYGQILSEMNKKNIEIPIIAIGGIKPTDVMLLQSAGVHGVAVSSAVNFSDDVIRTMIEFGI